MDPTTTYHHCRTDLQLYNVLYQRYLNSNRDGYMDSTTTYNHCRTNLQLYNGLYHGYTDNITTYHHCRTQPQPLNVCNMYTVLQPIITVE